VDAAGLGDLWDLGILVYCMCCGYLPIPENSIHDYFDIYMSLGFNFDDHNEETFSEFMVIYKP